MPFIGVRVLHPKWLCGDIDGDDGDDDDCIKDDDDDDDDDDIDDDYGLDLEEVCQQILLNNFNIYFRRDICLIHLRLGA